MKHQALNIYLLQNKKIDGINDFQIGHTKGGMNHKSFLLSMMSSSLEGAVHTMPSRYNWMFVSVYVISLLRNFVVYICWCYYSLCQSFWISCNCCSIATLKSSWYKANSLCFILHPVWFFFISWSFLCRVDDGPDSLSGL